MKLLNLQFSIFGSFFEIGNEKTNTEELQTILGSGYFINHLPVINAGANPPEQLIRIRVIGTDENQGIDIGFLPNRIDLNFTSDAYKKKSLEAGQSYDVRELTEKFRKIACKISDHYKLIGTRLAVNGRIITTEISSDYSEYIKASDFYDEKGISEWETRINVQQEGKIDNQSEIMNNIISISNSQVFSPDDGVVIDFDINTIPSVQRARFSSSSLRDFADFAMDNLMNILSSYKVVKI